MYTTPSLLTETRLNKRKEKLRREGDKSWLRRRHLRPVNPHHLQAVYVFLVLPFQPLTFTQQTSPVSRSPFFSRTPAFLQPPSQNLSPKAPQKLEIKTAPSPSKQAAISRNSKITSFFRPSGSSAAQSLSASLTQSQTQTQSQSLTEESQPLTSPTKPLTPTKLFSSPQAKPSPTTSATRTALVSKLTASKLTPKKGTPAGKSHIHTLSFRKTCKKSRRRNRRYRRRRGSYFPQDARHQETNSHEKKHKEGRKRKRRRGYGS